MTFKKCTVCFKTVNMFFKYFSEEIELCMIIHQLDLRRLPSVQNSREDTEMVKETFLLFISKPRDNKKGDLHMERLFR